MFQILGIIKKLAIISSNRIIGTISFGGSINASNDTLDAEKPKPLKPLTKEAKSITLQKNKKSFSDKSIVVKYSILLILEYFLLQKTILNDMYNHLMY